ncbi:uncharacterized protein [Argopecten irradians]|uniref:uncharacterized protein n=1 Tax=Argopecten irradians TaxID=31199 RepID=UPI0037204A4E
MQEVYKLSPVDRVSLVQQLVSKNEVPSRPIQCINCGVDLEGSEENYTTALLLTSGIVELEVSSRKCSKCKSLNPIDGIQACLINMGNYMVCHEILRKYLYYFLSGRSTIFTEYSTLKLFYEDQGILDFSNKFSYNNFKWSWYAFLELLEIDYETGFECPDCGEDPDTLIMDATSVSFRKELASWSVLENLQNPPKPSKRDKTRNQERTFLSKPLCNFLSSLVSKGGVEKSRWPLFLSQLEEECPVVVPLMKVIQETDGILIKGEKMYYIGLWQDFLRCLASSYPFCSFITTSDEVHNVLKRMCNPDFAKNDTDVSILQHNVPVIFHLMMNLHDSFPRKEFCNMLDAMIVKSLSPFDTSTEVLDNGAVSENISHFPSLAIKRGRGSFSADKQIFKNQCSKSSTGHPSLLPGVFTLFCKHGVCYGFEVMKYHESPNVPFTILRSRFQKAPSLVVYDNACNLHTYCLNRDPLFFKDTQFRVDALHFRNHKACGPSYELKGYPQHQSLNSQVVEQSNARLQRIKSQLSYMTQNNFMSHCKFYLWAQNRKIVVKNANSI